MSSEVWPRPSRLQLRYHGDPEQSKNMNLMEEVFTVNDQVLLIDTALAKLSGLDSSLRHGDHLNEPKSAPDHKVVMVPT